MSVKERRDKLLEQFQNMIQDEQRMEQLERMLNTILDQQSVISEEQWKEVERRDLAYEKGEVSGKPWLEVKKEIRAAHGI